MQARVTCASESLSMRARFFLKCLAPCLQLRWSLNWPCFRDAARTYHETFSVLSATPASRLTTSQTGNVRFAATRSLRLSVLQIKCPPRLAAASAAPAASVGRRCSNAGMGAIRIDHACLFPARRLDPPLARKNPAKCVRWRTPTRRNLLVPRGEPS